MCKSIFCFFTFIFSWTTFRWMQWSVVAGRLLCEQYVPLHPTSGNVVLVGVSGQMSDVDSSQHPHSTEKEPNHTRKYVTSQLQSLLQQHLQRNTALRSMQQQQQQQQQQRTAGVNPSSSSQSTTTAIPQLMPSIVPIMAMPPSLIQMPQPQVGVTVESLSLSLF